MKKRLILPFLLLCCLSVTKSQTATDQLSTYMQEVKKDSYKPVPQSILSANDSYGTLLEALKTYQNDSAALVRTRAYNISKRIGQKAESIELRQKAIGQQIAALDDRDSGIMVKTINAPVPAMLCMVAFL